MRPLMTSLLASAFLISLIADSFAAEPASGQGRKEGDSRKKKPEIALLKSMEVGDVACYVTLEDAKGVESTQMADFEICENEGLLGKRVLIRRVRANVMAQSCQGNPDCTQTETVNLISKLMVLP